MQVELNKYIAVIPLSRQLAYVIYLLRKEGDIIVCSVGEFTDETMMPTAKRERAMAYH